MGQLASSTQRRKLIIEGRAITAEPKETILQAAQRQGVDIPSSCRVGGCGTCKCKVKKGQVRELTETGYLLSAEELDQGYVLACQSVALTDLELEVAPRTAAGVQGEIVARESLTHDIVRLTVQLERPLHYAAGQFANLSIEGLPGVTRSYSFASPDSPDGRVRFYVRKVPGGTFSSYLHEADVVGCSMRVEGPLGDFWLRAGEAPLVLVAGGSGLAPILAMLEEGVRAGAARPVTLLFGARQEHDLYALSEIAALQRAWNGSFTFVPVLSEAPADASWSGARGLVTEQLEQHAAPGVEAYLCGPPAMVDAARALLEEHGVAREDIRFDRFTTQADAATSSAPVEVEQPRRDAGLLDYLKYFAFHAIGLMAAGGMVLGGGHSTVVMLTVVGLYLLGDAISGDDIETPRYAHPGVLTVQLWLALPLLSLVMFCALWRLSPGDPLGFGALVSELLGRDVLAARSLDSVGSRISAWVVCGLMIGLVGTIPAHELTHRTWDKVSMIVGRWLLAFSFDTNFAIEHVYGHHRYVATTQDPATAPRGRNVYFHVLASTVKGNLSAWHIETDRLRKKHLPVFSRHNAVLRGQAMSLCILVAAYAMGGLRTLLFFIASGLLGKSLLEIVNYMEHYGMVRNPAEPVQPRHSWNTNKRVSSWTMFNLTRHSHHHAQGEVPYQDLKPYPNAPTMVSGYLSTILLTLLPPLWHHIMTPKVLHWDRVYATDEERKLAGEANAHSGLRELRDKLASY